MCGVLKAIIEVDNANTKWYLLSKIIASCISNNCTIIVKAFDMNFFIYPLKAPPSELSNPIAANGIPKS